MKIVLDSVVETHHYQRKIRLKQGPSVKSKGVRFDVKELVLIWPAGGTYDQVIARGKVDGVWYRKAWPANQLPGWIREVLEHAGGESTQTA
jgi:hypothetical protein